MNKQESAWVEVLCDGGCGRRVGAYRPAVEAGSRVLCTVCHPEDLPVVPEDAQTVTFEEQQSDPLDPKEEAR